MIDLSRAGVDFQVVESTLELDNFWKSIYFNWESRTYDDIIPRLSLDKTFLDIGAWQGPISLVAQQYSKQCICFEPDPIAYSNLVKNIEVNNFSKIIAENLAVSSESSLTIGNKFGLGDGVSSYLASDNGVKCKTISISDILSKYQLNETNISVIKIDIEGYEFELVQDSSLLELKNKGVTIHLSLHPEFFADKDIYYSQIEKFVGDNSKFIYGADFYEILING